MSVLIKGMKMPKSCMNCMFCGFAGANCELDTCLITGSAQKHIPHSKMPDCPLIEVPDGHGRLIDADALIERMFDQLVAKTMMFGGQYVYTKEEINNAPTVIPSDKEGEE